MSISAPLPVSFPEPTVSSLGASVNVVIPTLNEAISFSWVLRRMPSNVDEVVIVDWRSDVHTADVAWALRFDVVVVDEQRKGKGVAVRARFVAASEDIIVMLDAEGSMDPQEISWFVSPLQHDYDFVKGPRYVTGGGSEVLPRAVLAGIRDWSTGNNPRGLGRAGSVLAVLASTSASYVRARRLAHFSTIQSTIQLNRTVPRGAPWREVQRVNA